MRRTRSMAIFAATSLLLLPLLGGGCGAEDPNPGYGPDPYEPYGPSTDSGQTTTPPNTPQGVSLTVDPTPSPTVCGETAMVRGTATPGSDVIVNGGSGPATQPTHPTTGRFCVDVPLRRNQENTLEVRASHPDLGLSEPKWVTLVHDAATCPSAPSNPTPEPGTGANVALGAAVTSKEDATENSVNALVDGDTSTWVRWGGGVMCVPWAAYDGWVKISLDRVIEVDKVVVHWRDTDGAGDKKFASEYYLLYSPGDGLGNPNPSTWLLAPGGHVTDGKGGKDEFSFNAPAKHIALWLKFDGNVSWCETFAIAEVEVFERAPTTAPPPSSGSATCDAVGSGI